MDSSGTTPDGYPMSPVGRYGGSSNELDIKAETIIDFRRDSKV